MNVNISGLKAESFTRLLRALNLVWNFHPQLRISFSFRWNTWRVIFKFPPFLLKICWSSWISLLPPPPTSIKQHPDFYLHSLLFLGVRKRGWCHFPEKFPAKMCFSCFLGVSFLSGWWRVCLDVMVMCLSVVSPWSPTPLTLAVADGGHGEDVEALDILATSAVVLTLSPSRRVPLPAPIWRPLVRSPWGHPRTSPCRGPQLELPCSVQDWSLTQFSFLSFIQSSIIVKIVLKNTLRQFCRRPFFHKK